MHFVRSVVRWGVPVAALSVFALPSVAADKKPVAAPAATAKAWEAEQPTVEKIDLDAYMRIRDEGMQHGRVMQFASALVDGIGPRLTGSPNMAKANEWTKETLSKIGLENAHLEDWGEFGMGWQQINSWARLISPDPEPLWIQAAPWSPATKGAVSGEAILVDIQTKEDIDKYKGKLAGKIVLFGAPRAVPDLDQPLFRRYTDAELKEMESYPAPRAGGPAFNPAALLERARLRADALKVMTDEGVAAIITPSRDGNLGGGTGIIFDDNGANLVRGAQTAANAVKIPNGVMTVENYGRLSRLLAANVPVQLEVNIETKFTGDHEHGFNTVAEIPGSDAKLKDQVVMVGGHLDSWVSATGATDNAAGSVVAMEAVRILKAIGYKPKRTIRIALWTGEEQGLCGSRGYVRTHFGGPDGPAPACGAGGGGPQPRTEQPAIKTTKEWETLDGYFNVDNGTGKLRGVYTQENYAIGSVFAQWIAPLKDLGITTISYRNTGGTDHLSFDGVGLPGFQFIQDPMDYDTRTHHSNMDTYERLHQADLEQAAIIEAIFLYNTSEREAMLPRKGFPHPELNKQKYAPIPGLFPNAVEKK